MNPDRELARRIQKQERENDEMRALIQGNRRVLSVGEARLAALKEALQILRKESVAPELRPGSKLDKVARVLRQEGKPLHITEILPKIGMEVTRTTRANLTGSLGTYIRDNVIFTRRAPNTFGLVEFNQAAASATSEHENQPEEPAPSEEEKPKNVVNISK